MRRNITIIIAEKDDGHATLIRKNLRRAGIKNETIHFQDGEETLRFLFRRNQGTYRKEDPEFLMLLDTQMPKISGMEILRQIKQDDDMQHIPVIMLTAAEDQEEQVKCHILGCSNYIKKPFDHKEVREAIEKTGLCV